MIRKVEAQSGGASACPSCGNSADAEYIILRIRDLLDVFELPHVRISVSCPRCRLERTLFQSYPLNMSSGILEQVHLLGEVLEEETGLPVFLEPPDDPLAGVREPRRPPPDADAMGVTLAPPT